MRQFLIVLIALLPLLGCGKKRTLTDGGIAGTITYKGNPVNGALLRFYPIPGPDPQIPVISVDQQGKFNAVIPPGEYKIVVEPSGGPPKGMGNAGMAPPRGGKMDPAKAEEMQRKLAGVQGNMPTATIPFPNKYKQMETTDLKATIVQGENSLNLELKDK